MPTDPVLSIVISNCNYGRFLGEAIDSALAQDYGLVEVVVVDDGSTDHSRAVIASYGDRVRAVLKRNGGHASAFNAGFAASIGEFVLFLDADDRLTPDAASGSLRFMRDPQVSQIHAPLLLMNQHGVLTGGTNPRWPLLEGYLAPLLLDWGPFALPTASCSGNIWSRRFLRQVMPMPEGSYRICADAYLLTLAALFGRVAVRSPFAHYRLHAANHHWRDQLSLNALKRDAAIFDLNAALLAGWATRLGLVAHPRRWARRDWRYQLRRHLLRRAGAASEGASAGDVLRAVWLAQSRWPMKLVLLSALTALLPLPWPLSLPLLCRAIAFHPGGPALFLPFARRE